MANTSSIIISKRQIIIMRFLAEDVIVMIIKYNYLWITALPQETSSNHNITTEMRFIDFL